MYDDFENDGEVHTEEVCPRVVQIKDEGATIQWPSCAVVSRHRLVESGTWVDVLVVWCAEGVATPVWVLDHEVAGCELDEQRQDDSDTDEHLGGLFGGWL